MNRIKAIQESDRLTKSPACYDIPALLRQERKEQSLHIRIWTVVKERFK